MDEQDKERAKERGLIRNLGDVVSAIKLILLKLDLLLEIIDELASDVRSLKK